MVWPRVSSQLLISPWEVRCGVGIEQFLTSMPEKERCRSAEGQQQLSRARVPIVYPRTAFMLGYRASSGISDRLRCKYCPLLRKIGLYRTGLETSAFEQNRRDSLKVRMLLLLQRLMLPAHALVGPEMRRSSVAIS